MVEEDIVRENGYLKISEAEIQPEAGGLKLMAGIFQGVSLNPKEHCLWPFALAEAAAPVLGPKSRYMHA